MKSKKFNTLTHNEQLLILRRAISKRSIKNNHLRNLMGWQRDKINTLKSMLVVTEQASLLKDEITMLKGENQKLIDTIDIIGKEKN